MNFHVRLSKIIRRGPAKESLTMENVPYEGDLSDSQMGSRNIALNTQTLDSYAFSTSEGEHMYNCDDDWKPILGGIGQKRCDAMIDWLYQQQTERLWTNGNINEGIVLKTSEKKFLCRPSELSQHRGGFLEAVTCLDVEVSAKNACEVTALLIIDRPQ